ncbi:MAG: trigger factor [bacterium]
MKNEHITEVKFEKEWVESIDKAFKKVRKNIEIDGFRKGTITKEMFIKTYKIESLYEEAINILLTDQNDALAGDDKVKMVVRPVVDIKDVNEESVTIIVKRISAPEVKLGQYKDLGIKTKEVKVSKKDIDEKIDSLRTEHADFVVIDKEIENGDMAVIDFSGIVEGEILEGGTGFDYSLEIGSNSFIPGFEEKLIGAKTGEERVLNLTFPEDYHAEVKGKEVEFTVTIKEVKEKKLPKIDKDFFEDLGIEVKDETAFRAEVEKNLLVEKEEEIKKEKTEEIFDKGIKAMTVEINQEIIDDEVESLVMEIEDTLKMQGMTMEMYTQMIGMDEEGIRASMNETASGRIQMKYFLTAVAKEEKIKATKKELDEKLAEFCEYTGNDLEQSKANPGLLAHIENVVIMEKTSEFLQNNN